MRTIRRGGIRQTERTHLTLSENIRTGRQLMPTFVLHFVNILVTNGITILFYYHKVEDAFLIDFLFIWVFSITAFCNLAIEITVIIYHPILHRNLVALLMGWQTRVFGAAKVADANSAQQHGQQQRRSRRFSPKNIDGRALIERGRQDERYFQQLRSAWA